MVVIPKPNMEPESSFDESFESVQSSQAHADETPPARVTLLSLPRELLFYICDYCPQDALYRLSQTSRALRKPATDALFVHPILAGNPEDQRYQHFIKALKRDPRRSDSTRTLRINYRFQTAWTMELCRPLSDGYCDNVHTVELVLMDGKLSLDHFSLGLAWLDSWTFPKLLHFKAARQIRDTGSLATYRPNLRTLRLGSVQLGSHRPFFQRIADAFVGLRTLRIDDIDLGRNSFADDIGALSALDSLKHVDITYSHGEGSEWGRDIFEYLVSLRTLRFVAVGWQSALPHMPIVPLPYLKTLAIAVSTAPDAQTLVSALGDGKFPALTVLELHLKTSPRLVEPVLIGLSQLKMGWTKARRCPHSHGGPVIWVKKDEVVEDVEVKTEE